MTGTRALLVAASLLAAACASVPRSGAVDTSYVAAAGERVLQQSVVIDATLAQAWDAFTTSEGLRSFVAPVAAIDLRVGGIWEASYDPDAQLGDPRNIRNEIVAYVPLRMLTIRIVNTPPGFPHAEVAKSVWTVIELEELGARRVRVTASMAGWKTGPQWDQVYDFFRRGNAQVFAKLQQRFAR